MSYAEPSQTERSGVRCTEGLAFVGSNCHKAPSAELGAGGMERAESVHFSSATDEWGTPQDFFDRLNKVFSFTVDVCCTHENAKCAKHYTRAEDGLAQPWVGERAWMNPPYGRMIGRWMQKAYEESQQGALVVCLVPARTDTKWWHDYAAKGTVIFLRGRLKFGGSENSAPFPSALVLFFGGWAAAVGRGEASRAGAKANEIMAKKNVAKQKGADSLHPVGSETPHELEPRVAEAKSGGVGVGEDSMRVKLEAALAENGDLKRRLSKAMQTIDELNEAAIESGDFT